MSEAKLMPVLLPCKCGHDPEWSKGSSERDILTYVHCPQCKVASWGYVSSEMAAHMWNREYGSKGVDALRKRVADLEMALRAAGKWAREHTTCDGERADYDMCPGDMEACPRCTEQSVPFKCPLGTPDVGIIDECWAMKFATLEVMPCADLKPYVRDLSGVTNNR